MKTIASLSVFCGILLVSVACIKKPKPGYSTFKLDQPFELNFDHSAGLESGQFKLTFNGIPEDSRCPKGVDCIQAGQARVTILADLDGENNSIEYVWPAGQKGNVKQVLGPYKVQLLDVAPYPEYGKYIKPGDYVLRLLVRKG